jgi:hypothetical protein
MCAKNHHDSGIVVEAEGVQRLSHDKDERKEERGKGSGAAIIEEEAEMLLCLGEST